ncbi:MAG TPA: hypothetical protein VHL09_13260 [Dehalococcoidia bacterium]|nr:hypothetical protein [Dehalococcoidia bacterium]
MPRNDRLGIAFVNGPGYEASDARYRQAVGAGAGWTRWTFYWPDIEQEPGAFDYSDEDAVVARDREYGLQINGILYGMPHWIPGVAGLIAEHEPIFTPDGEINPRHAWARYVYTTVSRYKGQIEVWEVWNEPDWPGWFWNGSAAEYYRLLQVAYLAAKHADPTVTVLFGGLCHWCGYETFFRDVLSVAGQDATARENNFYFDAVAMHIYVDPYYIQRFARDHRRHMKAHGIEKPIWINEANVPICGDPERPLYDCPSNWRATLDEQANFVIQLLALSAAAGIDRTLIFQLYDDGVTHDLYGLVRNDGSPRPAYYAFQTAARYFKDFRSATSKSRATYDEVVFNGPANGRVTVLWNTTDSAQTATVETIGTRATLVTKDGQTTAIQPENGAYRIDLLPATFAVSPPPESRHLIGGDPVILVEHAPPPTLRPFATSTAQPAVVSRGT